MSRDEFWTVTTRRGSEAYRQGQYRQARARFRAATRDARQRKDAMQVAISLHNLAVIYKRQLRFRKAFQLIKKSLALLERANQVESRFATDVLDKLAELSVSQGQRRQVVSKDRRRALAYLVRAHEIDCRIGGAYQAHMPKRLLLMAKLYFEEGDFENSCKYYKEACDTTILRHDQQLLLRQSGAQKQSPVTRQSQLAKQSVSPEVGVIDFAPPKDKAPLTVAFNKVASESSAR